MTAPKLAPAPNGAGSVDDDLTARRRKEIMLGACAVFDERGYANTRIADISASLGIGQGTIYRYFTGKDDLMGHIVAHAVRRMLSAMREDQANDDVTTVTGDRFVGQITTVTNRLLDMAAAEDVLIRVLLNQAPAALPAAINDLTDQLANATATYLETGVENGHLRDGLDARTVADAMTGIAVPAMRRVLRGELDAAGREKCARAIGLLIAHCVLPPRPSGA
jgi:AcrR family transcriptional regulator